MEVKISEVKPVQVNTGHEVFDQQTTVLEPGNVIGNTLIGRKIEGPVATREVEEQLKIFNYLPPFVYQEINGHLFHHRAIYVYRVRHFERKGKGDYKEVVHGYIVTDELSVNHDIYVTGSTAKSPDILRTVAAYVTKN